MMMMMVMMIMIMMKSLPNSNSSESCRAAHGHIRMRSTGYVERQAMCSGTVDCSRIASTAQCRSECSW